MHYLPRIDEKADGEFAGKVFGEALRVDDQVVVQVARVRGQQTHLLGARLHDFGITVTHVRHIVDAVEILDALLVEHVLALAAQDLNWVILEEKRARAAA